MSRFTSSYAKIAALLGLVLAFSAASLAKTHSDPQFSNIKIKNFGQMDERFYRGAQPKQDDYKDLAALGIKTIVDLTDKPKDYEKSGAEAVGMRYVNIAIPDKQAPSEEQIQSFMSLVNDPATGKFYVHCAGGRHRTGLMGAVYRFNVYGWNYDQAYAEMKDYDFYSSWGHGDQKKFVADYWAKFQTNTVSAATTSSATEKK